MVYWLVEFSLALTKKACWEVVEVVVDQGVVAGKESCHLSRRVVALRAVAFVRKEAVPSSIDRASGVGPALVANIALPTVLTNAPRFSHTGKQLAPTMFRASWFTFRLVAKRPLPAVFADAGVGVFLARPVKASAQSLAHGAVQSGPTWLACADVGCCAVSVHATVCFAQRLFAESPLVSSFTEAAECHLFASCFVCATSKLATRQFDAVGAIGSRPSNFAGTIVRSFTNTSLTAVCADGLGAWIDGVCRMCLLPTTLANDHSVVRAKVPFLGRHHFCAARRVVKIQRGECNCRMS